MKSFAGKIVMACLLLFCSCNSEKKQVKTALERMTSTPIQLNLDKMEARRNPLTKLDGKYKMVVYVDSSECTPCALSHLRFWNPLVKEAHDKKISIDYTFLLDKNNEVLFVGSPLDSEKLKNMYNHIIGVE